jgi:hypothetical protein
MWSQRDSIKTLMQYLNKKFSLPACIKRMTQTDYEIAVGLRHPDGTLVQPKVSAATPRTAGSAPATNRQSPFAADVCADRSPLQLHLLRPSQPGIPAESE